MPFRVCSKLVTLLLVLGLAAPLAAQDDDADKGDDSESGDEDAYAEPDAWEAPPQEEEKVVQQDAPPPPPEVVGDGRPYMVGLTLGWGFNTDRTNGGLGADPYGLGIGVAGGYSFDFQLYVGLRYVYFLGSSDEGGGGRLAVRTDATANYMLIAAEAGYDLWAAGMIIRPSLLIGAALGIVETVSAGDTYNDTVGDFLLGPGFSVNYPIDSFYIGGDLRGHLVMGDGVSGVGINVIGGARFE